MNILGFWGIFFLNTPTNIPYCICTLWNHHTHVLAHTGTHWYSYYHELDCIYSPTNVFILLLLWQLDYFPISLEKIGTWIVLFKFCKTMLKLHENISPWDKKSPMLLIKYYSYLIYLFHLSLKALVNLFFMHLSMLFSAIVHIEKYVYLLLSFLFNVNLFAVQLIIYLLGTQSFSNLQCQLLASLMLILCVVDRRAVM